MFNATKIRLYPTDEQSIAFAKQFGCVRWVYNNALAECQTQYRETGKSLNYHALAVRLPKLKQEFEWLREADAQALQQSVQHLSRAFENFFAKRGAYPTFKSKRGRQSFSYPQRVKFSGNRIYCPKVGWVKCVIHREMEGKLKTVTISRTACGHFYASILRDDGLESPDVSCDGKVVGVDVGLSHLAITSDGIKIDNKRIVRKHARNLKRKQQKLSRKQKGSKRREKARRMVARVHERIANARKDHLHKVSRKIVNENQVIAVETLNIKGMTKNHNLAKSVLDAGWGMLSSFLEYKAARDGKLFLKIDRWFPSSKTCSSCGHVVRKIPLNVRSWSCTKCGANHDRDVNAAINIRDEAIRTIKAGGLPVSASGGDVSHEV